MRLSLLQLFVISIVIITTNTVAAASAAVSSAQTNIVLQDIDTTVNEISCSLLRLAMTNTIVKILSNSGYNAWRLSAKAAREATTNTTEPQQAPSTDRNIQMSVDAKLFKLIEDDMIDIYPFRGIRCLDSGEFEERMEAIAKAIMQSGRFLFYSTKLVNRLQTSLRLLSTDPARYENKK